MSENKIFTPIIEWPNVISVMNRFYQQQCIKVADELGIPIDPDDYLYGIEQAIPEQHISQIQKLVIEASNYYGISDELTQLLYAYEGEIAGAIYDHMDSYLQKDIKSRILEFLDVTHDAYQEFHEEEK